ncbi:excinuclease ABC subunit UvrA [Rickettsia endosymbiont of Cardiosporidium cionae]|uniref:excinuclease ABC subunit UvrA n=1 Tax=Rickettsia endosymbiont of Cardiosporidium cionae TaxID=2777155 RepID=UPI0018941760|nr:excinuclease ABC subunit UvrA [Rickettsia endosymbiont of Cardiosporidium cionae]KAF8818395.1 excinuclease ABC subunit UvrA [Rickettsia endosymbiont of Cardiosporidium cionae]
MQEFIRIRGAKEHNLKNVDVDIPREKFIVVTGLSGSGKSSLAFDTIYAEGQRRYVESLSFYARQFLHLHSKPDVESIVGLSPAIAIDQKTISKNPRSTVGTLTEIYDYMRILYARAGVVYSPATGLPITKQSLSQIVSTVMSLPQSTEISILAPVVRQQKGEFRKEFISFKKNGYTKVQIDDRVYDISDLPNLNKNQYHNIEVVVDNLEISDELGNRLADGIETALDLGKGIVYIVVVRLPQDHNSEYTILQKIVLSAKFACPESGFQIADLEPRLFSFNSPFGACTRCEGIGQEMLFDEDLMVPDQSLSILDGAIAPWSNNIPKFVLEKFKDLSIHYGFDLKVRFADLPDKIKKIIFYGSGDEKIKFQCQNLNKVESIEKPFGGIIASLEHKLAKSDSSIIKDELLKFTSKRRCSSCRGYRLKFESLCIKIGQMHIGALSDQKVSELYRWFSEIESILDTTQKVIAAPIVKEIRSRLSFLVNVGLGYITLSRAANTLSGGEGQRIRLASQIGSGLSGVLYVLDEPSIGLHQKDNSNLIQTLEDLRDLGNTVIVVEHDEDTMISADYIIDVGPGAGIDGGEIVAQGTINEIKKSTRSITAQYLTKKQYIAVPSKLRTAECNKILELSGAKANNLKNIKLSLQLGLFTVITGVSGSGKSSLIIDTLYKAAIKFLDPKSKICPGEYLSIRGLENIDKVIDINQSPIGRTPRSNPATYTGVFSYIRDWFAELVESKVRGYKVGRFSFNVQGGRCESCHGDGLIKIEMYFLSDIYIKCDVCGGKRYNNETLEIKFNDNNISDVLNMTVTEAVVFFKNMPSIYEKLTTLEEVGLGYVKIGQSATTLSGGEAQRIKLAKELSKKSTGRTLYILDEPTTGLHIHDIKKLLSVLHKLVDKGNTVVVIEHNMEVIKTADYVIDMGPEGGDHGGEILVEGPPSLIAATDKSYTGHYLKPYLYPM